MKRIALVILASIIPVTAEASNAPIRIGFSVAQVSLPVIIAKELNLFEKNGLDFDGIERTPASMLLAANAVDGTVSPNADMMIRLNSKGVKVKIVASLVNVHMAAVIVRNDFDNSSEPITVRELKGSEIGIISLNTGSNYVAFRKFINHFGLRPGDINLVQMNFAAMLAALSRGQIKAAIINSDLIETAKKMGLKVLLDFTYDSYPNNVIAFREDFIKNNPQTVLNFLKAIVEAINVLKNDKPAVLNILAKYYKISDPSEREYVYDFLLKVTAPDYDLMPVDINLATPDDNLIGKFRKSDILDLSFVFDLEKNGFLAQFKKHKP